MKINGVEIAERWALLCESFLDKRGSLAGESALKLIVELSQAEEQLAVLQWQLITPQNLPKMGDEAGGQDNMSVFADGSFLNIFRAVSAYTQSNTAEEWHRLGYHHFRAINLPAHTPEDADAR